MWMTRSPAITPTPPRRQTPDAGLAEQSGHQYAMRRQQVGLPLRPPICQPVIRSQGIAGFLDFARRGDDPATVQNGGYLDLAQGIALDGQRTLNRADAVGAP